MKPIDKYTIREDVTFPVSSVSQAYTVGKFVLNLQRIFVERSIQIYCANVTQICYKVMQLLYKKFT